MDVADLFEPAPFTWGLRGDPHLWRALATELRGTPLPADWFALRRLVTDGFARHTGRPLRAPATADESVSVAAFTTGSGMSDGAVSVAFWHWTAVPLLVDRWRRAVGS